MVTYYGNCHLNILNIATALITKFATSIQVRVVNIIIVYMYFMIQIQASINMNGLCLVQIVYV